jgi:hypothetical protein
MRFPTRLAAFGSTATLVVLAVSFSSVPGRAWWVEGGPHVVIAGPPIILAPRPSYVAPPVVYPAPPVYVAPPQRLVWVPGHWNGRYWIPPHWG